MLTGKKVGKLEGDQEYIGASATDGKQDGRSGQNHRTLRRKDQIIRL